MADHSVVCKHHKPSQLVSHTATESLVLRTVGVVRVHVRTGDVPPLDGGIDSATETLLATGGHGQ